MSSCNLSFLLSLMGRQVGGLCALLPSSGENCHLSQPKLATYVGRFGLQNLFSSAKGPEKELPS